MRRDVGGGVGYDAHGGNGMDGQGNGVGGGSGVGIGQGEGWCAPRDDINAPDLYIPSE